MSSSNRLPGEADGDEVAHVEHILVPESVHKGEVEIGLGRATRDQDIEMRGEEILNSFC